MMHVLLIIFALLFALLPQFWVRKVFAKYQKDTVDIQGTGGELAIHLLKKLAIKNVKIVKGVFLIIFVNSAHAQKGKANLPKLFFFKGDQREG